MKKPFQAISAMWRKCIEAGIEAKKEFQADADECMRFFNGPYNFLYGGQEMTPQKGDFAYVGAQGAPRPSIMMTVNKVAEAVQLFGPSLYHRNPVRKVNSRHPPEIPLALFGDPNNPQTQAMMTPFLQQMAQAQTIDDTRASLVQGVLNYLPTATDLKDHCRRQVDEAIIKGMGVMWTEVYRPVGAKHKIVGSFQDSVNNLILDPDAETMADVKWCARRCVKPVWEFEAEYGLNPGSVKGNRESGNMLSAGAAVGEKYKRKDGKTSDLIVYWKIWSKMGIGGLLRGIDVEAQEVDKFGQYVHLVVAEDVDYLLNLPESIWGNHDEMYRRAQWETPYWADDAWPFDSLIFHEIPDKLWPQSHFKPALGELKFINWAFSFMASKMHRASKDFIAMQDGMDAEFEQQITNGSDYEILKLKKSHGESIDNVIKFLQHPPFNKDFWTVIQFVMDAFEKRTGLTELMYGQSSHQYRSAAEADAKQQQLSIRPDDMANKVEDSASRTARREALAARWHMDGQDVGVIFGPQIGGLWDRFVASADLSQIVHQLQFGIEAGSARKRNKDKDVSDANSAMQSMFQPFLEVAMSGQVGPFNAMIKFWGDANDLDVSQWMLQPPPPPPEIPPEPDPRLEQEQDLKHGEDEHKQAMRHAKEKHELQQKLAKQKAKEKPKATSNGKK